MNQRMLSLGRAAVFTMAVVLLWACHSHQERPLPLVAITQIATHPALDEVRAGLITGLKRRGYVDGSSIKVLFRNANGDPSLALPIAQDFVRRSPAVIVPISTPSALAVAKTTRSIPIVFSGVTDPVGSGLVQNLGKPGENITGVCDRWPFEAQVRAFLNLFPKSRRIGMLYTRGDDVSKVGVEAMSTLSKQLNFELRLMPVSQGADLYTAAVSLLRNVDTIYTGIDHLVLENLDGIVKAAREAKKPLFGGESGTVEKGGVLALSINMTQFGDMTAELVAKVLGGQKPGDVPVAVISTGDLLINAQSAAAFGLDINALERSGARIVRAH